MRALTPPGAAPNDPAPSIHMQRTNSNKQYINMQLKIDKEMSSKRGITSLIKLLSSSSVPMRVCVRVLVRERVRARACDCVRARACVRARDQDRWADCQLPAPSRLLPCSSPPGGNGGNGLMTQGCRPEARVANRAITKEESWHRGIWGWGVRTGSGLVGVGGVAKEGGTLRHRTGLGRRGPAFL